VPYDPKAVSAKVPPYNLVVLAKGEKEDGRLIMSYKRPVYNARSDIKAGKKPIGEVSYLLHVHDVNMDQSGKKGTMRADFNAHHTFTRKSIEYDINYTGQVEWVLGLRKGQEQETIDKSNPQNYMMKVGEVDTLCAVSVLKDRKKINYGNNVATLENDGDYRVRGVVERYDF
jgi:hypothetical protein